MCPRFIYISLLLLCCLSIRVTEGGKICPANGLPFDYNSCDPEVRSQCPAGFTCREGTNTNLPNSTVYLCCESSSMTIGDWLAEAKLAPQIFPQLPQSTVASVHLLPIDPQTLFPSIHIGDEVVVISYPTYLTGIVQSIELPAPIASGYAHIISIIGLFPDGAFKPFGIFLNYNILTTMTTGTMLDARNGARYFAYVDNSTAVPKQESYRSQYVVFVFYSPTQLTLDPNSLLGNCSDSRCFFNDSPFAQMLNQPISGTLFYLTTKQTMYRTTDVVQPQYNQGELHSDPSIVLLFAALRTLFLSM